MTDRKVAISRRVGYGFTGVLLVAGVTLYIAKKVIVERRKAELDRYRATRPSRSQPTDPKSP